MVPWSERGILCARFLTPDQPVCFNSFLCSPGNRFFFCVLNQIVVDSVELLAASWRAAGLSWKFHFFSFFFFLLQFGCDDR